MKERKKEPREKGQEIWSDSDMLLMLGRYGRNDDDNAIGRERERGKDKCDEYTNMIPQRESER